MLKCKVNCCGCSSQSVTGTAILSISGLSFESTNCNVVRSTLCDALYNYDDASTVTSTDKLLVEQCVDFTPTPADFSNYSPYTNGWALNPLSGSNITTSVPINGAVTLAITTATTPSTGSWEATFTKNTWVSFSYTVPVLPSLGEFNVFVDGDRIVHVTSDTGTNPAVDVPAFKVGKCQTLSFQLVNPSGATTPAMTVNLTNFAVKQNVCNMASASQLGVLSTLNAPSPVSGGTGPGCILASAGVTLTVGGQSFPTIPSPGMFVFVPGNLAWSSTSPVSWYQAA